MRRYQFRLAVRLTALSAAILLTSGVVTATARAQSEMNGIKLPASIELPREFVRDLARIEKKEDRFKKALDEYTRIDVDDNGVTQADIDQLQQRRVQKWRRGIEKSFRKFATDSDDVLTRQEITDAIENNNRRSRAAKDNKIEALMMLFRVFDTDRDDKLTLAEYFKSHTEYKLNLGGMLAAMKPVGVEAGIMTLDFDRDGTVSRTEYTAAISQINPNKEKSQIGLHNIRIAVPGCRLPEASKNELIVFVAGRRGRALSTVSTAGQDEVTVASELIIEGGNEPLYIILSSPASILWSFKGATQRVSKVFVRSSVRPDGVRSGSGVAGIDPSRVNFVKAKHCLRPVYGTGGQAEARTRKAVWNAVGREPDRFLAKAEFGSAILPNGEATHALQNEYFPEHLKYHLGFLKVYGGGLLSFDTDQVVSLRPAEAYEVLPGYAGLHQLQEEGKIEKTGDRAYRIKKPMRIPAGLGRHGITVEFVLPAGIEMPTGDWTSTCLVIEETGERVGFGASCRK